MYTCIQLLGGFSCVWHDWFICDMTTLQVAWLILMCQESFICAMTHCAMMHALYIQIPITYVYVYIHIHVQIYMSIHVYDRFTCGMTNSHVSRILYMYHDSCTTYINVYHIYIYIHTYICTNIYVVIYISLIYMCHDKFSCVRILHMYHDSCAMYTYVYLIYIYTYIYIYKCIYE